MEKSTIRRLNDFQGEFFTNNLAPFKFQSEVKAERLVRSFYRLNQSHNGLFHDRNLKPIPYWIPNPSIQLQIAVDSIRKSFLTGCI